MGIFNLHLYRDLKHLLLLLLYKRHPYVINSSSPPPQKPAVSHKTKRVTAAAWSKQITSFQKEIDRALGVSLVLGGPKGAIEPHDKEEIENFVKRE